MNISVFEKNNTSNDKPMLFSICFDYYGNLYLDGSKYNDSSYFKNTNSVQYMIYQINIDEKNELVAEMGDYKIIDEEFILKKNNIKKFVKNENNLEKKIKMQENEYFNEDLEYYVIEDDTKENDEYLLDDDSKKNYGIDNVPFIFSESNTTCLDKMNIKINHRKNGDICALYDTYIYNDNNLILKSNSYNETSIYRIFIENELLKLKLIGESEKKYIITIDEEKKISFIK